jgi:hypothetical protein
MILPDPPKKSIQSLNACVGGLGVVAPDEWQGNLPCRPFRDKNDQWIIGQGDKYFSVTEDPDGEQPLRLDPAGQLSIYIRVKRRKNPQTNKEESELAEYSLTFSRLAEGDACITSLRYDFDPGNASPKSADWDEELNDNIAHPKFHLHVNFHYSERANALRLALGQVSPILVLQNFCSWYPRYVNRARGNDGAI